MSPSKETKPEHRAVTNFREYLRIPSVQPNINYDGCVAFLRKQADSLALPIKIYSVVPGKPIVIITWAGTEPTLPSVLLNSHMDVVPVFPAMWTHDPFSAEKDKNGNIYARGSQDMKCVGIQYLEAVRRLRAEKVQLLRTIHISFVPDEEIGGKDGMEKFVHTADFRALNVGFAMDEGVANPTEEFSIFNGERSIWHIHVHCTGSTGHGSILLPDTAGEKLRVMVDKFMDFRQTQKERMKADPRLTHGDVTSVNLTMLQGGVQSNVVPPELTVTFDVRLSVDTDHAAFEAMLDGWCAEAGKGTYITFSQKEPKVAVTKLDDSNPWWVAIRRTADDMKLKLKQAIFTGGTDSRYVRGVGLPAIGFSPMNNTPILLHDHDEFLNEDVFLRGIDIYCRLLPAVGNVEPPPPVNTK